MRAIDFAVMSLLIHSLLSLLFGLVCGFSTLGVCAFGIVLSIVALCIGPGRVRSISFLTLGSGVLLIDTSVCGGLVVSSKVTRRGSGEVDGLSGAGSGSGTLLRMSFSFVNASI